MNGTRGYNEALEALNEAIEIMSDPERWTHGCGARDKAGVVCNPNDSSAVRWCAYGAIEHCARPHTDIWERIDEAIERTSIYHAYEALCPSPTPVGVLVSLNDVGGRRVALAFLREAQAILEVEAWFETASLREVVREVACAV